MRDFKTNKANGTNRTYRTYRGGGLLKKRF